MPGPATKLGSMTGHGGTVLGPGCPTVLINKVPAIRVGADMHLCPTITSGTLPFPHIGMTNIGPGVPSVLIGGMPAATVGANFLCAGSPAPVLTGAFDVLIATGDARWRVWLKDSRGSETSGPDISGNPASFIIP